MTRTRTLRELLLQVVDAVVPPGRRVLLGSTPDLDDNLVALLRDRPGGLPVTAVVQDVPAARTRAARLRLGDVRLVDKRSLRGMWEYARARVEVSTHGLYACRRRRRGRTTLGLWHGELGKTIGPFAGEGRRHFDWVPVSSTLSRAVRSAEFVLPPERVVVAGLPRQVLLRRPTAALPPGRHVVWVPTYRTSVAGARRADGDAQAARDALPLDDPALGRLLAEHDATLWYRPHPSAQQDVEDLGPRARRATDADLEQLGLTFYELLAGADCLVTDYSSVWVDFLLADRPMVSFCPDLDAFRATRGMALEPHEQWFPGPVVTTAAEALTAVDRALREPDADLERRRDRRALLHTATDDPVAAVWDRIRAACP